MSDVPQVFFSYSLTKSANPRLVEHVIDLVKQKIRERQWGIVDPMEPNLEGIREKVEAGLWQADAAIIEATTSSPNVMFEAGFSRALSYPCVFLVDLHAFEERSLGGYFGFLGLNPQRPLPADLGDLEYLRYPSELGATGDWADFERRVEHFVSLLDQLLSPEAILTRRSVKAVQRRAIDFLDHHSHSHPLIGFLGGRLQMLADGFEKEGPQVFQTDARNYRDCLAAFDPSERRKQLRVRAIADLTADVERFWNDAPDPLDTLVAERIFLTDWTTFFDVDRLDELNHLLQRQREHYPVRVGRKHDTPAAPHILGADGVGDDLLLIEPDVLAGYVDRAGGIRLLRVERNRHLFRTAEARYASIRARTVEVKPGMSASQLRRAWLEFERIGQWDRAWGEHERRPPAYFRNYDQHIRCWIPHYDGLVRHCAAISQRAIAQRMRESDSAMNILEIGFGTGALTRPLLAWSDNLNAPVEALQKPLIVASYVGIDAAQSMKNVFEARALTSKSHHKFGVCTAPDWAPLVKDHAPYDVVCGSLVFHDMVAGNREAKLRHALKEIRDILKPNGYLVLADIFVAADSAAREEQLTGWRKWMRLSGLSEEEIAVFMEENPEMVDTATPEELGAVAVDHGFQHPEVFSVPGAQQWSPFKVAVLRKQPT